MNDLYAEQIVQKLKTVGKSNDEQLHTYHLFLSHTSIPCEVFASKDSKLTKYIITKYEHLQLLIHKQRPVNENAKKTTQI